MTYEKILETSKGSEYFRDSETGIWLRKKQRMMDEPLPGFYIGSINPDENDAFVPDTTKYHPHELLIQIYRTHDPGFKERSNVPGFVPRFEVGNSPLGVFCRLEEILEVEEGRIKIEISTNIHVGHPIVEVYTPLPPFMEQNLAK